MAKLHELGELGVRERPILLAIASQIPLMLRRRRWHDSHSSIGLPSGRLGFPFFPSFRAQLLGVNRRSPKGLAANEGRGKAKPRLGARTGIPLRGRIWAPWLEPRQGCKL